MKDKVFQASKEILDSLKSYESKAVDETTIEARNQYFEIRQKQLSELAERTGLSHSMITYTCTSMVQDQPALEITGTPLEILDRLRKKIDTDYPPGLVSKAALRSGVNVPDSDDEDLVPDSDDEDLFGDRDREEKEVAPATPSQPSQRGHCTIGLLAHCCDASYRVREDVLIDVDKDPYKETVLAIHKANYTMEPLYSKVPMRSSGTSETSLGVSVFSSPHDQMAPVIITYRGTKDLRLDIPSDINLGITGTVSDSLAEAAYQTYLSVSKGFPGRQIILSGHSLGGHLAHYVAARAYTEDPALVASPSVQVRTFNTAPYRSKKYRKVLDDNPRIEAQFINYRLHNDVVSSLPLQEYPGNTFHFRSTKGKLASHTMGAMHQCIPEDVKAQVVGKSSEQTKYQGLLTELVNGSLNTYRCRIKAQYASKFRRGSDNLKEMEKAFPLIVEDIKKNDTESAIKKLLICRAELKGKRSIKTIDDLLKSLGKAGVHEYRVATLLGWINSGELNTASLKAQALIKYCELETDPQKVRAIMGGSNARIMLENSLYINPENLERSQLIVETLLEQELAVLHEKSSEEIARQSSSSVLRRNSMFASVKKLTHAITGKDPDVQINLLARLKGEDGQFVSVAELTELLEDAKKAFLVKDSGKVINLIKAVIELQTVRESSLAATAAMTASEASSEEASIEVPNEEEVPEEEEVLEEGAAVRFHV